MGDGGEHRGARTERAPLPGIGSGRHFSWTIVDDLDVPETQRRASAGVRIFDARAPLLTKEEETALGLRIRSGTDERTGTLDDDARDACHQLVTANLRLCVRPARANLRSGQDFEDITQNAMIGLIRAAVRFDPSLGSRFATYAMFWIRQAISRGIDGEARLVRLPSHVAELQRRIELSESQRLIDDDTTLDDLAAVVSADVEQVRTALDARFEFLGIDDAEDAHRALASRDPRSLEPDDEDPALPGWIELLAEEHRAYPSESLSAHVTDALLRLSVREQEVLVGLYGLLGDEPLTLEAVGQHFDLTRDRIRQIRDKALEKVRVQLAPERHGDG